MVDRREHLTCVCASDEPKHQQVVTTVQTPASVIPWGTIMLWGLFSSESVYQDNNNSLTMGSASSSTGTTVLPSSCSRCAALAGWHALLTDDASAMIVTAASNMSYFSSRWYCHYQSLNAPQIMQFKCHPSSKREKAWCWGAFECRMSDSYVFIYGREP